jgi:hypothetical protein
MHKTIVYFYLLLLSAISSCGVQKNTSAQAMEAEFKECLYSYTIPGEANALIEQEFSLELLVPIVGLSLDSLVLVDGRVNLQKQENSIIWQGTMQWNFKEEGQLQEGDSAIVYGHRTDVLLMQKVQLSRGEDLYLPAQAPN